MPELHSLAKRRVFARVGTTLRRKWRIVRLLGVGGMAAVYEAVHANGSRVAIKALHVELSVEEELRERFLREGYAANKVEHPGAVRILDDDLAEDGSVFLIMELLEGETLAARAQRFGGKLDEASVLAMADKLLDVLAAAHDRGIVHRDVKPENVFITCDGLLKLLDFGVARVREATTLATHAGSTLGTPAFMSPEQARGRAGEVDARADVWGAGASMFNVLSGELVHPGETANEQLVQAMTEPARSLGTVTPGASKEVVGFVDRALAFAADDRWQSARAMQAALREVWKKTQPWPLPDRLTPAPPSTSPRPDQIDRDASTMGPEELAEHAPTLAFGSGPLATARALTISRAPRGARGVPRVWWLAMTGVAAAVGVALSIVVGHLMTGSGLASVAGGGVVVPAPVPPALVAPLLSTPALPATGPAMTAAPPAPHLRIPAAAPSHARSAAPPTRDKLLDQWH